MSSPPPLTPHFTPLWLICVKIQYYVLQGIYILPTFAAKSKTTNYQTKTNMNVDNAKSQMRKGMLEYCIMLLLSEKAYYTSDIIRRLKEANLLVVEGTLYPLLTRLKNDGLLGYEWQESTQGPPRKYYVLTDEGKETLEQLDAAWGELESTVHNLKERRLLIEN